MDQRERKPHREDRVGVDHRITDTDQPDRFKSANAQPSSEALDTQPQKGQVTGFDFYRDPLDAKAVIFDLGSVVRRRRLLVVQPQDDLYGVRGAAPHAV